MPRTFLVCLLLSLAEVPSARRLNDIAEALADQIERWLTAAGFHGIDGLDDVSC